MKNIYNIFKAPALKTILFLFLALQNHYIISADLDEDDFVMIESQHTKLSSSNISNDEQAVQEWQDFEKQYDKAITKFQHPYRHKANHLAQALVKNSLNGTKALGAWVLRKIVTNVGAFGLAFYLDNALIDAALTVTCCAITPFVGPVSAVGICHSIKTTSMVLDLIPVGYALKTYVMTKSIFQPITTTSYDYIAYLIQQRSAKKEKLPLKRLPLSPRK